MPFGEVMEPYWVVELAELEMLGFLVRFERKQPMVIVYIPLLLKSS
jgi:hypothetical protein